MRFILSFILLVFSALIFSQADTTSPTAAITYSAAGPYNNDDTVIITATFNEAMADSPVVKIGITGVQTLAATAMTKVSTTVYTYNYQVPAGDGVQTISLSDGTDVAGNTVTAAPTSGATFTIDNTSPTITITAAEVSSGASSNDSTLSLTFTLSESHSGDFSGADIDVSGGSISNFTTVSSTVYTATFTPSAEGTTTIYVLVNKFTDDAGNNNIASNQFSWTYDTTAPTITITSAEVSDGATSNDSTLSLTFTSSEATSNFAVGDITVSGGTISNFTSTSSTVYTATFTPASSGATTIDVAAGVFTDAAGNNNTAATQFNWTYNVSPTNISLSSSSIDENSSGGTEIGTLSSTDSDSQSHTYSLVSGDGSTDNSLFEISGSTLSTASSTKLNYESKNSYLIRIRTNDGSSNFEKQFTVSVNDVAEAPVSSNVSASTTVNTSTEITLVSTDPDFNSLSYSIVSNPSKGTLGTISGNKVTYTPNNDFLGTDSFTFKSTDSNGNQSSSTKTVTIKVFNGYLSQAKNNVGKVFGRDQFSRLTHTVFNEDATIMAVADRGPRAAAITNQGAPEDSTRGYVRVYQLILGN